MLVYIPEHLRDIPIIEQLYELLLEYSNLADNQTEESFDKYKSYLKSDPVRLFIEMQYSLEDFKSKEEFDNVITYLTKLFYSVKGTEKVIDYVQKYLFRNNELRSIRYSPERLLIEFRDGAIKTTDVALFYDSLLKFFNALLYFGSFDSTINTVDLVIEDKVENYVSKNILCYKHFNVKRK